MMITVVESLMQQFRIPTQEVEEEDLFACLGESCPIMGIRSESLHDFSVRYQRIW